MKQVTFVPFDEIDKVKWNSCIHYAVNGNIFGYHWYLTNAVRSWDALVYDDYETVFPLISRNTFPYISELYQPSLLGKLGVYSVNMLSTEKVNAMLQAIPKQYRAIHQQLNDLNRLDDSAPLRFTEGTDHSLYLKPGYDRLHANYKAGLRNCLSRSGNEWYFDNSIAPERFIAWMKRYAQIPFDIHAAHRLLYNGLHRGIAMIFVLRNASDVFVGGALLLSSHGRLYHILSGINPDFGREKARSFLWDRIIRTYADRPLILDFNRPGKTFPSAFGARSYDFFILNKEDRLMRWTRAISDLFGKRDSSHR